MKMITHDEGLRLLGLWTLATERYRLLREAEHALNRAIGLSYQGHVSDALNQSAENPSGAGLDEPCSCHFSCRDSALPVPCPESSLGDNIRNADIRHFTALHHLRGAMIVPLSSSSDLAR